MPSQTTESPPRKQSHFIVAMQQILKISIVVLIAIIIQEIKRSWRGNDKQIIQALKNEVAELENKVKSLREVANNIDWMTEVGGKCGNGYIEDEETPLSVRLEEETVAKTMTTYNSEMEKEVINQAKRSVLEKFGKGPYRVEMMLEFPPDKNHAGIAEKIVIEMAPLELMPYTVSFFLEQVFEGLYDGCSFHHIAEHVIIAGPTQYVHSPFLEARLAYTAIQEYHPEYPHLQYTLGYTIQRNRSGHQFYINTVDNSEYQIGQACFAKVVEGFDVVDRIHKLSRMESDVFKLVKSVGITKAQILGL